MTSPALDEVVRRLRESHRKGGAFLECFEIGADDHFHWFASRNRLTEDGILTSILSRPEVREALPALLIPSESEQSVATQRCCTSDPNGFRMESAFAFDGHLAQQLYLGGAYSVREGNGRTEKQIALDFCNSAFDLRFAEVRYYVSWNAWTRWFLGVAWDWTAALFDLRSRKLWLLALTDSD